MEYLTQFCPICETGRIGLLIGGRDETLLAGCDECDSCWLSPGEIVANDAIDLDDLPPRCLPIRWASAAEVSKAGADSLVAGTTSNPGA